MNEFKNYHPIVNFIYFVFVIGFSMFFMHPICLVISFLCGFLYSVILKGKKTIRTNLIYMLPMALFMALINPAFNHQGAMVLTYLPGGNPLTFESVIYGLFAAMMVISVICWFSCYNEIMTSDKFMYLFGKIIPALSLVLSMTLRFVPRFMTQLKIVINARRCMGRDVTKGSILKRAKNGLSILSIMTTWALENAIETASSMNARGSGHSGRSSFSIFTFDTRDMRAIFIIVALGIYTLAGSLCGAMHFAYFPSLSAAAFSVFDTSVFVSYLIFCMCPIIIECREARRWKVLRSKI